MILTKYSTGIYVLSFLHFFCSFLIGIRTLLGNSGSPCADRGCTDSCSSEGKHTDTIFNVVRQNCLHPRERFILLDIEIHGRRLHLLQWQQGCCHCSSLFFLYSHVLSLNLLFTLTLLSNNCLFYRHFMVRQDPQNEALIMLHYLPSGSGVFAHNNGNFLTESSYLASKLLCIGNA